MEILRKPALTAAAVTLLFFLAFGSSVSAHHGQTAAYALDQTIKLQGIVREVRWVNPHVIIAFDVKGADLDKLIGLVYEAGLEQDCFFWFGNPLHVTKFRALNKELALKINVRTAADHSYSRYHTTACSSGVDRAAISSRRASR